MNRTVGLKYTQDAMLMLSFLLGLNQYLTLNTSGSGTILIDLSPDDKEFQSVEDEVYYSCISLCLALIKSIVMKHNKCNCNFPGMTDSAINTDYFGNN